jgi:hypothetical protein
MSVLQFSPGFIFSDRKKSTSFISDFKVSIIELANFALLDLWLTKIRFVSVIGMSSGTRLRRCGSVLTFQSFARLGGLSVIAPVAVRRGSTAERAKINGEQSNGFRRFEV